MSKPTLNRRGGIYAKMLIRVYEQKQFSLQLRGHSIFAMIVDNAKRKNQSEFLNSVIFRINSFISRNKGHSYHS